MHTWLSLGRTLKEPQKNHNMWWLFVICAIFFFFPLANLEFLSMKVGIIYSTDAVAWKYCCYIKQLTATSKKRFLSYVQGERIQRMPHSGRVLESNSKLGGLR